MFILIISVINNTIIIDIVVVVGQHKGGMIKMNRISHRSKLRNNKRNKRVYEAAEEYGLYHWEVADLLGIREETLSKKLRYELPEEEQEYIIDTIRNHCTERE